MHLLLEREDQTDDLRREGDLSVCRDGARAFCSHAGSLGDLGQNGLKKIAVAERLAGPDAIDATTETSKIDLRLYLMCIYKLVLFEQLAEAW